MVRDGEVPHTYRSRLEEYLTQLESSNYAVFSAMESQIRDDLIVVYVDVLLLGSTRRHVVLDNNKVRPATYKENWRVMAAQVVKWQNSLTAQEPSGDAPDHLRNSYDEALYYLGDIDAIEKVIAEILRLSINQDVSALNNSCLRNDPVSGKTASQNLMNTTDKNKKGKKGGGRKGDAGRGRGGGRGRGTGGGNGNGGRGQNYSADQNNNTNPNPNDNGKGKKGKGKDGKGGKGKGGNLKNCTF